MALLSADCWADGCLLPPQLQRPSAPQEREVNSTFFQIAGNWSSPIFFSTETLQVPLVNLAAPDSLA